MADIKQAASWMKEGKRVRRNCNPHAYLGAIWANSIKMGDNLEVADSDSALPCVLCVDSLLADDWEIANNSRAS